MQSNPLGIPDNKDIPHRWFIIVAVMLSTIMEILDTTIVNVSLPHMMGSLSADRDEISWVLTSYIVAAGIFMPLTGFLVNRFGSRRLLLINIIGFMLASGLCGISTTLPQIVFFRLLQGVFGASLVPLSQFILRDTFPLKEQPKMMAIWGVGVMAAPIMGPTLGGYITDTLNWRWIFYINVPICIINFFLVLIFIRESPFKKEKIDWLGMFLVMCSIGSLQIVLDRGQVDDWFNSDKICILSVVFVVSAVVFFIHSFTHKKPIINLRLFKDRNFAIGTMIMAFFAAAILGSLTLFPQMLETLFGYTSNIAGITMAPRGIASALMMAISSRLMVRGVQARWLVVIGLVVSSSTTWLLGTISLDADMRFFVWLGAIQGLGIGCFFVPLSTIVYTTLPHQSIAEAAGLFSFGRNIGNAMGISLLTTFLSRNTQFNWNIMGAHIRASSYQLHHWLAMQHLSLNNPLTIARLGDLLNTQANFVAYAHTYKLAAIILIAALILALFLKAPAIPTDLSDIPPN